MSGISKFTVLKSTQKDPSGPQFDGLNQKLSDPGGGLDLVQSPVHGDFKTDTVIPHRWEGGLPAS